MMVCFSCFLFIRSLFAEKAWLYVAGCRCMVDLDGLDLPESLVKGATFDRAEFGPGRVDGDGLELIGEVERRLHETVILIGICLVPASKNQTASISPSRSTC